MDIKRAINIAAGCVMVSGMDADTKTAVIDALRGIEQICKHGKHDSCEKYRYCLAHNAPVSTCPEREE